MYAKKKMDSAKKIPTYIFSGTGICFIFICPGNKKKKNYNTNNDIIIFLKYEISSGLKRYNYNE